MSSPAEDQNAEAERAAERARWSSEPAFVFSMAAAAVGLGNLWRFPYMVGENGGAPFIIAYLVALFVIALPVMMLEVGAGRMADGNVVATFAHVHRWARYYGWAVVGVTALIMSYYLTVTGWTIGFAAESAMGGPPDFEEFTSGYASLWFFLGTLAICSFFVWRGVGAIERLSWVVVPLLVVLVGVLVVFALSSGGAGEAASFLLSPDFSQLSNSRLWFLATGQAFYSFAIGQGYLVTYGSHVPQRTHVPRACIAVAAVQVGVALLAGWMIFPFVFAHDLEPAGGTQLAFSTMPVAFENLANGTWLAIAFFFLFAIAAISSCVAGLKVVTTAVREQTRFKHVTAAGIVAGAMLVAGLPSALSFTPVGLTLGGTPVLDFVDQNVGTEVVITSGVIGGALFGWFVPKRLIRRSLGARNPWWEWRVVLVGRALPMIIGILSAWHWAGFSTDWIA